MTPENPRGRGNGGRRIGRDGSRSRTPHRPRPALHQHDPDAVDRRDPEGQLWSPRHADGVGAGRVRALAAIPALRPRGPDLAEPRPLRALEWPRLDAALLAASPDGC